MMNKKLLLGIGAVLIAVGFFQPDLNLGSFGPSGVTCVENFVTDPPANDTLLVKANVVVGILQDSDDSTKSRDCEKLSALYSDIATLLELDEEDKVVSDTASIKKVNSIAGKMLRLDIQDKYPNLAEACKDVVAHNVGTDDVSLDDELRTKAVEAFRALSWAFYKGR
jgi:hypothetical protein